MRVVTTGSWPAMEGESALIDHVAVSGCLEAINVNVWGRHIEEDERRITDHAACSLQLQRRD